MHSGACRLRNPICLYRVALIIVNLPVDCIANFNLASHRVPCVTLAIRQYVAHPRADSAVVARFCVDGDGFLSADFVQCAPLRAETKSFFVTQVSHILYPGVCFGNYAASHQCFV